MLVGNSYDHKCHLYLLKWIWVRLSSDERLVHYTTQRLLNLHNTAEVTGTSTNQVLFWFKTILHTHTPAPWASAEWLSVVEVHLNCTTWSFSYLLESKQKWNLTCISLGQAVLYFHTMKAKGLVPSEMTVFISVFLSLCHAKSHSVKLLLLHHMPCKFSTHVWILCFKTTYKAELYVCYQWSQTKYWKNT